MSNKNEAIPISHVPAVVRGYRKQHFNNRKEFPIGGVGRAFQAAILAATYKK